MKRDILLETVAVHVPESALEAYEAALASTCSTVGFFRDEKSGDWHVEGIKPIGVNEDGLTAALALAVGLSGIDAPLTRRPIHAEGWLARNQAEFPEQRIGRRFAIRGTHLITLPWPGRITLTLDAGAAFGSGEHGSTRGCLRAIERVAWRRPLHIVDIGTGSGILAIATARLLHRRVLATDIEQSAVRVARQNVLLNRLGPSVQVRNANGWRNRTVRRSAPYDLVLANILARPLCRMACQLAPHLAPGGTAILSGLVRDQFRAVLAAHLRRGLRLETSIAEGPWVTLILRRPAGS